MVGGEEHDCFESIGQEVLRITAGRRSPEIRIPGGGMIRCRRGYT